MPWQEVSIMSLRQEFVVLASQATVNMRALCRRFGISPKTGYKWVRRFAEAGALGLLGRSRCPQHSPQRTDAAMEAQVVAVRDAHPAWGGRKIRARLQHLGHRDLPSPSTITEILRRQGRLNPAEARKHRPWQRFEHEAPNRLWQMDFKGHFALTHGGRCHPLTVLDDHSRYAVCLQACADQQAPTVQGAMTATFRRYGLPASMLMDNGSPWGDDRDNPYTRLTVWLLRLGIQVRHSRPYHPQTQGKDERFHRTLAVEVLRGRPLRDIGHCQQAFDTWRLLYNGERPHESLQLATPASRYTPSPREFPEQLPALEYGPGDHVRKVQAKGEIFYQGRAFRIGKAFHGYPVALRATGEDGVLAVYFGYHRISQVHLRNPG